jgi:outer membrane receptor protein involved in Fe transport
MYNFSDALNNVVDLIVGASHRVYDLNSGGTIFDDLNRNLTIKEYGAYTQLGKKLGDKLKLTAALRFDKNENFEGRFTPRFTAVYSVADNNNIRASYQTGFRNPTNQDQYIDLAVGGGTIRLIGGLPSFIEKYNLTVNPAYTSASYRELLATGNPAALKPYTVDPKGIRPERVQAFELGYRGLQKNKLLIDTYGYYNIYNDYISSVEIYQNPDPGNTAAIINATRFNMPVNSTDQVTSWGAALGMDYLMSRFSLNGNVSYNELGKIPADYLNDFNTPKVRFNLGVTGRRIIKNAGFNINYRWQDSYFWQSSFATGAVPAFGTLDAQVNFKLPLYNSMIKIGGSNLLNKYYFTSYGNPAIGGMYYLSLIFDQGFL